MAPLTWREVSAPNFGAVNQAQAIVGDSINAATKSLQAAIQQSDAQKERANTANFMGQLLGGTSLDQIQGVDPAYLSPDAFNFALKQQAQADANALGYARIAALGARKGKGAAASNTIPVAPGSSDGNFLTSDNEVVNGVVTDNGVIPNTVKGGAKAQGIPVAPTVVGPFVPTSTPSNPAPVENFRDMPSGGPLRSDAAPVDQEIQQTASGSPTASQLFADATATYGAPIDASPSLAPTPGPLRGAQVKGADGAAQIFPELTRDLVNGRIAAFNGDPVSALAAAAVNKRLGANLTGSNALTLVDNTLKTATQGQEFREGQRKEEDALYNRSVRDSARSQANEAILQPTLADARLAIDPNQPPDEYAAAQELLEKGAKAGQFDVFKGQPARLPSGEIIVPSNNKQMNIISALDDATRNPEVAKVIQGIASKDGAQAVQDLLGKAVDNSAWLGRDLRDMQAQHESALTRYDTDRASNPLIPSIVDFQKNVKSDAGPDDVARQLAKDASTFSGRDVTPGNMLTIVQRVAKEAHTSPAIAGGLISAAFRDQRFGDTVRGWFGSTNGDLSIDPNSLEQFKNLVWDSTTNKPNNDLLNQIDALKASDRVRDDLNRDWEALQTAQAQYNEKAANAALRKNGEGKAAVDLAKEVLVKTQQQYQKNLQKFTARNGVTTQNRGTPALPPVAVPVPAPPQGPNARPAAKLLRDALGSGQISGW